MKTKNFGKKAQVDVAIVIGSIIIPISALVGALVFAWLLISPVTDLCRYAETIAYDVSALKDVVYSVPDDLTIIYGGPADCGFYSDATFPETVVLANVTLAKPQGAPGIDNYWYRGSFGGGYKIAVVKEAFVWYAVTNETVANCSYSDCGNLCDAYGINWSCVTTSNPNCPIGMCWNNSECLNASGDCYAIRGLATGQAFQIGGTTYTINAPSSDMTRMSLGKESDYGKKNAMACMNFNLIITKFDVNSVGFNTKLMQNTNVSFPFFSKSNVPAMLYDSVNMYGIPMAFQFRSYTNPSDTLLGESGGVTFDVDDGVIISKSHVDYYDTISTTTAQKDDALVKIVKSSKIVCENADATVSHNLDMLIPARYKLNASGSSLCLWWESLPDKIWHNVYCYNLSYMKDPDTGAGCNYGFDPTNFEFYNETENFRLDVSISYNSLYNMVVINGTYS